MKKHFYFLFALLLLCGYVHAMDILSFPLSVLKEYRRYINKNGKTEFQFLYRYGNLIGLIIIPKSSSTALILKVDIPRGSDIVYVISAEEKELTSFDDTYGLSRAIYIMEKSAQDTFYLFYDRGY